MSSSKKKRELNRARTEADIAKAANWSDAAIWKAGCVRMETEIADLKRQLEQYQSAGVNLNARKAEISVLKRQLEKMTADRNDCLALAKSNFAKLLESQAREARLREALENYKILCQDENHYLHYVDALKALDLPQDDTALREYRDAVIVQFLGEFKRHVGGDGEFWLHELEDFYDNKKAQ